MLLKALSFIINNINFLQLTSHSLAELLKLWDAHAGPKSFILIRYARSTCWAGKISTYGIGFLIWAEIVL